MEAVHDAERLAELQALPLERKIQITQARIIEWYQYFDSQVYVSFSGGKDSTVLLDIARKLYPDIHVAFLNTGLEYPETQRLVKEVGNVDIVMPPINFQQVIQMYGYPLVSKEVAMAIHYARRIRPQDGDLEGFKTTITKRYDLNGKRAPEETDERRKWYTKKKWLTLAQDVPVLISHNCCYTMKKGPMHKYQRKYERRPILGPRAEESLMRRQAWIKNGCNAFEGQHQESMPMAFWLKDDVLAYIAKYNVKIADVYGTVVGTGDDGQDCPAINPETGIISSGLHCTGCDRVGCIFCAFGAHMKNERSGRVIRKVPVWARCLTL